MSTVANQELRQAVAAESHRAALHCWLDALDEEFGPPTANDLEAADLLLDLAEGRTREGTPA